jgi:hypothetical protein
VLRQNPKQRLYVVSVLIQNLSQALWYERTLCFEYSYYGVRRPTPTSVCVSTPAWQSTPIPRSEKAEPIEKKVTNRWLRSRSAQQKQKISMEKKEQRDDTFNIGARGDLIALPCRTPPVPREQACTWKKNYACNMYQGVFHAPPTVPMHRLSYARSCDPPCCICAPLMCLFRLFYVTGVQGNSSFQLH